MQNPSGIYRSHQINEIWMCSDRKNDIIWGWLVNLALKSLVENYSWNRMIKKTYCVAVVQDLVQRTFRPPSQPPIIFKQKEVFQEIDR